MRCLPPSFVLFLVPWLLATGGFAGRLRAQGSPAPSAAVAPTPAETAATPAPAPVAEPQKDNDSPTMEASFDFSQGVVLLDVDLSGGHVVKLALDTGDEGSVLDRGLAEELKLPFDQLPFIPEGKGPDISVPQIAVAEVGIGDGKFLDKPFLVLPLAENLKMMGITCRGTIGYRFFADQVIQIDYPGRKLRKLAAMPPAPAGAVVLPMQWKKYAKDGPGVITTDQFKLGNQSLVAQFDSLFARTMILFATQLPNLESKRLPELPSAYYESGVLRAVLPTQDVTLGSHRFEHTPPAYIADKDAKQPDTDISVVLGNVFFLDAVVTLDYKNDKLMIEWK